MKDNFSIFLIGLIFILNSYAAQEQEPAPFIVQPAVAPPFLSEYACLTSAPRNKPTSKIMSSVDESTCFFGLFDGLGADGHTPANYCAQNCARLYKECTGSDAERLDKTIAFLEQQLICKGPANSGTAAVLARISKENIVTVANVGDTRATVLRPNVPLSQVLLTQDHRPVGGEKQRLLRLGAWVTATGHVANSQCPDGKLTVTRILGDAKTKRLMPEIIATPEICSVQIQPHDVLLLFTQGVACPLDCVWRNDAEKNRLLSHLFNRQLSASDKGKEVLQACARQVAARGQHLPDNAAVVVMNGIPNKEGEKAHACVSGAVLLPDYFDDK